MNRLPVVFSTFPSTRPDSEVREKVSPPFCSTLIYQRGGKKKSHPSLPLSLSLPFTFWQQAIRHSETFSLLFSHKVS